MENYFSLLRIKKEKEFMSTNISGKKREELISKINQIKTFIEQNAHDRNAANLLSYLGELTHEVNGKKYGLVFEEHREAIDEKLENNAPVFTEEKELFIDGGGELNFLLEGDNLASLKLLEKTHRGKIDVIYIDPPYNTGKNEKQDFHYDDNFIDGNDSFRHSKWLSFMDKRLQIASELLTTDGIIFISIGDDEQCNLEQLCNKIFGESNKIENYIWESTFRPDNSSSILRRNAEFILCYAKNKSKIKSFKGVVSKSEGMPSLTKGKEKIKTITFPANTVHTLLPDGRYTKGLKDNGKELKWELVNDVEVRNGYIVNDVSLRGHSYWATDKKIQDELALGTEIWIKSESFVPYYKKTKESIVRPNKILNQDKVNDYIYSNAELENILGKSEFNNPKPTTLISFLADFTDNPSSTILDFFAGSGTTGHAVLKLNAEDGGHRKFILCTNNENSICREITYERLKTVITGKRRDGSVYSEGLNGSLKYFKTDFIDISEKMYYEYADELLLHVKELVELENAVNFDKDSSVAIVLSDEELEEFVEKVISTGSSTAITLYMGHDVLPTGTQERILKSHGIKVNVIPDYYYRELAL